MEEPMRNSIKLAAAPVLLALFASGTAGAADTLLPTDRSVGFGLSYLSPGDRPVDYGIGFDLSYAGRLAGHTWLEGKAFTGILETGTPTLPDFYQSGIGADLVQALGDENFGHFFLLGGGGVAVNDATPDSEDGSSYYVNAGLGYRTRTWETWGMRPRVELRFIHDSFGEGTNDVLFGLRLEIAPNRQVQVEKEVACVAPPVEPAVSLAPADTDGDGVLDAADTCPGTLKGARVDQGGCVKEEQKISLPNIEFQSGSTVLAPGGKQKLEGVVEFMSNQAEVQVDVFGHTDAQGKDAYNQKLSEGRAKSVMEYFVSRGIDAARLSSKGFGETQPISSNETAEGRAQNRRVELLLRTKKEVAAP
jgi:OOP family OmpA-OmpF porin